jgi:hypothetical protein
MKLAKLFLVAQENGLLAGAVLEAGEIGFQFRRGLGRQAVDHPVGLARGHDNAMAAQIGEVLGDFDLRFAQQLLKMADAQGAVAKQVEHPKPGPVAQALINLDKVHGFSMGRKAYTSSWRLVIGLLLCFGRFGAEIPVEICR